MMCTIYTSEYFYRKLSYSALHHPKNYSVPPFNPAPISVKKVLNVA